MCSLVFFVDYACILIMITFARVMLARVVRGRTRSLDCNLAALEAEDRLIHT